VLARRVAQPPGQHRSTVQNAGNPGHLAEYRRTGVWHTPKRLKELATGTQERGFCGVFVQPTVGREEMKNLIARFVREEEGQDLVEYALLLALIALAAVVAMNLLGGAINLKYEQASTTLSGAS
jgi:pilus assembly protein Flp/PilA